MGTSGGAMAAAIYGNLLHADKTLCFSPPSTLIEEFETRGKAFLLRMRNTFAKELLEVKYYFPSNVTHSKTEIIYANDNEADTMQVEGYKNIKGITITPILNCTRHDVLNHIAQKENLADFFQQHLKLV